MEKQELTKLVSDIQTLGEDIYSYQSNVISKNSMCILEAIKKNNTILSDFNNSDLLEGIFPNASEDFSHDIMTILSATDLPHDCIQNQKGYFTRQEKLRKYAELTWKYNEFFLLSKNP